MKYKYLLIGLLFVTIILFFIYKRKSDKSWLDKFFKDYYELGFFSELGTDNNIKNQIILRYTEEWDSKDLKKQDRYIELLLLAYDENVLFIDTESDVGNGNNVYLTLIEELSEISRGAFTPTDLSESWSSDEGPIEISYTLGGKRYELKPEYNDDYIDINIIRELNKSISGYSFEVYEPYDQSIFIFFLNDEQKYELEIEKEWKFMW